MSFLNIVLCKHLSVIVKRVMINVNLMLITFYILDSSYDKNNIGHYFA